jgi:hypothetical protein
MQSAGKSPPVALLALALALALALVGSFALMHTTYCSGTYYLIGFGNVPFGARNAPFDAALKPPYMGCSYMEHQLIGGGNGAMGLLGTPKYPP